MLKLVLSRKQREDAERAGLPGAAATSSASAASSSSSSASSTSSLSAAGSSASLIIRSGNSSSPAQHGSSDDRLPSAAAASSSLAAAMHESTSEHKNGGEPPSSCTLMKHFEEALRRSDARHSPREIAAMRVIVACARECFGAVRLLQRAVECDDGQISSAATFVREICLPSLAAHTVIRLGLWEAIRSLRVSIVCVLSCCCCCFARSRALR